MSLADDYKKAIKDKTEEEQKNLNLLKESTKEERINRLDARITLLEAKNRILEKTIETLKNIYLEFKTYNEGIPVGFKTPNEYESKQLEIGENSEK